MIKPGKNLENNTPIANVLKRLIKNIQFALFV